jgi:integrase
VSGLTEVAIRGAKPRDKAYKIFDGDGLFLLVTDSGAKHWRFKYRFDGREKLISLGSYPAIPLKLARERRQEARTLVARQIDPSAKRKAERDASGDTFKAIASEWLELQRKKLRPSTLKKTVWVLEKLLYPYIGTKPVGSTTAPDILAALRRTESRGKHETAHRAKQVASVVFRYAIATGRAERDPTADLRGALAPVVSKNRAAITQPARVGELLRAIDAYEGQLTTEIALRLAPYIFVRPGELRNAQWEEIELDGKSPQWRIPAPKTKMGDEHIVPLSTQAVALLREIHPVTGPNGLVFPGLRAGSRPISENTINAALRRIGYSRDEMTAHGFRAMASTNLNELGYSPDVIELQLAHKERNKVRAAYNRAQRLSERRQMMQAWADYLDGLRAPASTK